MAFQLPPVPPAPGFNFTPPPGPVPPPQNLQQMALQAFRPPPPMSMGAGMGGMQAPQQQQGFGAAQGAGMLSGALAGFKGFGPNGIPTPQSQGLNVGQIGNGSIPNFTDTGFQPAMDFLNGGFGAGVGPGAPNG